MSILPRLAVGTIQAEADLSPIVWAMVNALEQEGVRTQSFHSRACFKPCDGAAVISGNRARHLDSWLMTPEVCRQTFLRSAASADLSVVEGRYDQAATERCNDSVTRAETGAGGSLDLLCQWLALPRIAVVDVQLINDCHIPRRPNAGALLLDHVGGQCDFHRWQTNLESLWNIPVIGGLGECEALRRRIAGMSGGAKPAREWCDALTREWRLFADTKKVKEFGSLQADRVEWPMQATDEQLSVPRGTVHVAVAYDEAFRCYFPDTLDMLEQRGATVRVFSPMRDECLPAATDIVYLGCGSVHEHVAALADNHCMLMALKEHVCSGKRIYAEGGGLAYLCQDIETPDGKRTPVVGALRAVSRRNPIRQAPAPVEITLSAESWLGAAGTKLRGYRNSNWTIEATGCVTQLAQGEGSELELVGRHQAIGSRIHFNFAAQPKLLTGFLKPCPAALAWSGAP